MTSEQKDDLLYLFSGVKGNGDLDFVSCWFLKASNFIDKSNTRVAVSTIRLHKVNKLKYYGMS